MPEITTEFDAKANLVVAEEALAKAKRDKLSDQKIKLLERHVKESKTILKQVRDTLKASRKK